VLVSWGTPGPLIPGVSDSRRRFGGGETRLTWMLDGVPPRRTAGGVSGSPALLDNPHQTVWGRAGAPASVIPSVLERAGVPNHEDNIRLACLDGAGVHDPSHLEWFWSPWRRLEVMGSCTLVRPASIRYVCVGDSPALLGVADTIVSLCSGHAADT